MSYPITDVEEEIPTASEFKLEQNYANPFDPSTKISWQSPIGTWQTLKVYDMLGREVAALVVEYKSAGSCEVEFSAKGGSASGGDACNLPSRIYFYALSTGSLVETKKTVLIR